MNQIGLVNKVFELHRDLIYCSGANMAPNWISKTSPSFGRMAYRNLYRGLRLWAANIWTTTLWWKDCFDFALHNIACTSAWCPSTPLLFIRDWVMVETARFQTSFSSVASSTSSWGILRGFQVKWDNLGSRSRSLSTSGRSPKVSGGTMRFSSRPWPLFSTRKKVACPLQVKGES